ncbi:MAG TPA: hypothetical protein PKM57_01840 [Kiritimatiellia bacterium]|nr:hypothetical protein [Kiritimatiellia bacterium]HPS06989.1 hypothetical protein [Kiritimatiellia bacterium]
MDANIVGLGAAAFAVTLAGPLVAGPSQERAELLVDVDVYDNQTVAPSHYDAPFYGPKEIDALFARCRSNGVKKVTWRSMAQIASYPSRLNYNVSDVPAIRSNADARRAEGAFAAKIGVAPNVKTALPELKKLPFGGLVQRVENGAADTFVFSGAVSSKPLAEVSPLRRFASRIGLVRPSASGAFLAAVDAVSGRVLARSREIASEAFQTAEIRFSHDRPFYVGSFSYGRPEIHVFVADALSLKDGAGRERLANGGLEESDRLLEPEGWRLSGANFVTLNGDYRAQPPDLKKRRFPNGEGAYAILHRPNTAELFRQSIASGDTLALAGLAAKRHGIELYAWFDPIDDGRRTLPPVQAWSSKFLEEHPSCRAVDREGRSRWGLLCFGYPEVRRHKADIINELLSYEGVAGVALKMHYQHNLIWDGNRHDYQDFLYNDVALSEYHARWGKPADGAYDAYKLRTIYGGYVLDWLREIRPLFEKSGKRLCLFQAPASMLDSICGGWVLPPEKIVSEKLCDDVLIEPRHRGDSVQLVRDSERIRALLWLCRRNGVRAGFDFWLPGVPAEVKPAERGVFMREQLSGLARAGFDFLGVYEEMCLVKPNMWPRLGEARRAILAAPPGAVAAPDEVPRRLRNVLSVDKGGSAYEVGLEKGPGPVTELIDGDDSHHSSVTFETKPVVIELVPAQPARMNRVVLKGGNLSWKNQCAPEDFTVEGRVGGVWRRLADVRDAATRNRHDNTVPVVCRFEPAMIEKLRVTVTRSSDAGKRFLVLREVEAFVEE